jgi:hypothetical protein
MTETPFDAEAVLQAVIAQHPEMLVDETAGQGPLLFLDVIADTIQGLDVQA